MKKCSRCKKLFQPTSRHKCCGRCRFAFKKAPCQVCGERSTAYEICIRCANQRKGEGWVNSSGYRELSVTVDGKQRKVLEHRLVYEQHIGRALLPGETVHHKNGNKVDNRMDNLELWVSFQPSGQRPEDLLAWADEIIKRYRT